MAEVGPKEELGHLNEEEPVGGMPRYILHIDLIDIFDQTKKLSLAKAINKFMRDHNGYDPRRNTIQEGSHYEFWGVRDNFFIGDFRSFVETELQKITSCKVGIVMLVDNIFTTFQFKAMNEDLAQEMAKA